MYNVPGEPTTLRHWVKALVPPAALAVYRRARYGKPESRSGKAGAPRFLLPRRTLAELFAGIETETVQLPASEFTRRRDMVLPLVDLLSLLAIARRLQPGRVFEIGTYTGSSTLALARALPGARIYTLDLPPTRSEPSSRGGPAGEPFQPGSSFHGHPEAERIDQLYGDSRTFDYAPFLGNIDLVFVDANHTYDFVKADSETAFRLIRPGGVIVWDDYLWEPQFPECAGVTHCLDELRESHDVVQLAGTRLALYIDRRP